MTLQEMESNIHEAELALSMDKQEKRLIEVDIESLDDKINLLVEEEEKLNKVIIILTQAAATARDNARAHFEKIVTDALQFIVQSKDYEFVIQELPNRAKASYEFYIKSTINGVESLQKPEEANGGGFIDIITVAAKYAYLEIFNDPKIMSGSLLFDEPAKMISEQMSIKFAEYIKFLGNHYNRQTIMITHNENIANVADNTFMVSKDINGISKVQNLFALGLIEDNEKLSMELAELEESYESEDKG